MPDSFKISDAAWAVNISQRQLSRLLDRKLVRLPGPEPGKGYAREFRVSDVHSVAIGNALMRLSVAPATAMKIVGKFFEPQRGRLRGCPFETGRTVLIATPDGVGAIHQIQPEAELDSLITADAAIVLDIGKIISKVNLRLQRLNDEDHSKA